MKRKIMNLQNDAGKLICISYSFGSFFGGQWDYSITKQYDELYLLGKGGNGVDLNVCAKVSDKELGELAEIIESNGIHSWNGFDEFNHGVLDGYGFDLIANFENGTLIASGYEIYPDNYEAGHEVLRSYFEKLSDSKKNKKS